MENEEWEVGRAEWEIGEREMIHPICPVRDIEIGRRTAKGVSYNLLRQPRSLAPQQNRDSV